jgi:hypothetical protein
MGQAWLIVIDLPKAWEAKIHGAIANDELERYWQARAVARAVFEVPERLRRLIATMRRSRRAARELVQYRVRTVVDGLCAGEPDAHTLVQFEQSWIRASARNKRRVAASYGLHVPAWFMDDSHYQSCLGCMHQLFAVDVVAPAAGDDVRFARSGFDRFDLATFGTYVDALDRWLAAYGDPEVASLDQLQAAHPPPRDRVPRVLWDELVTADLADRIREPDTQVLLGHVPAAQIAGAIHLGTRDRLAPLVRPGGGETLVRKLAYLARTVADRRRESGRAVVLR